MVAILFEFSVFEGELADSNIPVIHTSLAGCRIIGRMCVGKLQLNECLTWRIPLQNLSSLCWLISDNNRKFSVLVGTLLYILGSCESHSKFIKELFIPFGPIPKENALRHWLFYKLRNQQRRIHSIIGFTCGFTISVISCSYKLISFKLCMMIEAIKLYILISVWMILTFIQGHSCMRNQKLLCIFFWGKFLSWFG